MRPLLYSIRSDVESKESNMNPPKRYGLLQLKSSGVNKGLVKKPSIFGNDSDEEDPQVAVNQMIGKESTKAKLKRQTQMQIEAALTQDPTVYEYDSVYDSLHSNEQKKKVTKPEDRKAKYIGNLMKAAEARKKEYERRLERQVHKEREAEQGMYDDKEEFVTEAYKRKMQEQQEEEEQERRQDQMEAMLDVTKQKNLSGFYRHLLNQTTGEEAIPEGTTSSIAVKKEKVKSESTAAEVKKEWPEDGDIGHSSSSGSDVDSNVSAGSEDEQHRGEEKHGRQHREHHQKDYVGEDKDHSRKELGGHYMQERLDSNRRKVESEQQQKEQQHTRHNSESESDCRDARHRHKKRQNRKDGMSSSCHKASEASNINKHKDKLANHTIKKHTEKQHSLATKFAKRNVGDCVDDAKMRYLARKRALKAAVIKEDD